MNLSQIKSFWRNILFPIPHVKVIYKLLTLGYEVKTIKNFEDPISFFVPSGDYSGLGNSGIDKKGRYEGPLLEKFSKSLNSNSVVLDIGANVGIYTLIAGKKTRNIHSFEPDPYFVYLLKKNVKYSNINATIVQKFVGDKNTSKMITIDTYCSQKDVRPTHIKIDIEGYEMFLLHGMNKTLTRYKPKLSIEFHEKIIREQLKLSKQDINNFFGLLKGHGYYMIFNGHHYDMSTSKNKLYNFEWHSIPPNNVNYACIAECSFF
jgi:hypothetical protein